MTRHLTLSHVAPRLARAQSARPRRRVIVVASCRASIEPTRRGSRR